MLYGSETWTVKARDAGRITAAEMKYMRRTAEYTWTDYRTNSHIAKELEVTPVLEKTTGIQKELDRACKQNAS